MGGGCGSGAVALWAVVLWVVVWALSLLGCGFVGCCFWGMVVDPTGAGDSYGAGFISGLVEGLSISNSMIRGTAMASFCIEDFGVQAMLDIKEDEYLKRINSITTT